MNNQEKVRAGIERLYKATEALEKHDVETEAAQAAAAVRRTEIQQEIQQHKEALKKTLHAVFGKECPVILHKIGSTLYRFQSNDGKLLIDEVKGQILE